MPTLDAINDRIASLFGRNLAGRTRLDLRVAASPATLLKFADVGALLAPPSTVAVLSLGAGHGVALLILEGDLAYRLLGAALGDRKLRPTVPPPESRGELTRLEQNVLRHLLGMLCDAMAGAWANVLAFRPEILRFESDRRMVMISSPTDVTILCSFEIVGVFEGRLQLAVPYAAVEPAKKLLTSPPRPGGQADVRFSSALAREIQDVAVELRVEMGRRTLSLEELLALSVGDVITLGTSERAPLPVSVQGRPKMTAAPRVVGGGLAIEILRALPGAPPPGRAAAGSGPNH
jgi:flagellar motor switch protein FliM